MGRERSTWVAEPQWVGNARTRGKEGGLIPTEARRAVAARPQTAATPAQIVEVNVLVPGWM